MSEKKKEFCRQLAIVHAGLDHFKATIGALVKIREEQLWEGSRPQGDKRAPEFESWEDFLDRGLPPMSRQHKHRLRAAVETVSNLSPGVTIEPTRERQIRAIAGYPGEVQRMIWELAVAMAKHEGRDEPNEQDVLEARDEVLADLAAKEAAAKEAAEEDAGDAEPETAEELAKKINEEEDKAYRKLDQDKSPEAIQARIVGKILALGKRVFAELPRLRNTAVAQVEEPAELLIRAALRLVEAPEDDGLYAVVLQIQPMLRQALEGAGLKIAA